MEIKLKKAHKNNKQQIRKEILDSMIASFKIEGVYISIENAIATLKKVEASLEK